MSQSGTQDNFSNYHDPHMSTQVYSNNQPQDQQQNNVPSSSSSASSSSSEQAMQYIQELLKRNEAIQGDFYQNVENQNTHQNPYLIKQYEQNLLIASQLVNAMLDYQNDQSIQNGPDNSQQYYNYYSNYNTNDCSYPNCEHNDITQNTQQYNNNCGNNFGN